MIYKSEIRLILTVWVTFSKLLILPDLGLNFPI